MKVVNVLLRDQQQRPIRATVRDIDRPVEVVCERGPVEWIPIYARNARGEKIELPRCFALNGESMRALEEAS